MTQINFKLKEERAHNSQKDHSTGFGGKFGVQNDRRDSCAEDYSYSGKTDAHQSAKDYSKGFGGKFGVQKDRQGTVNVLVNYSSLLI